MGKQIDYIEKMADLINECNIEFSVKFITREKFETLLDGNSYLKSSNDILVVFKNRRCKVIDLNVRLFKLRSFLGHAWQDVEWIGIMPSHYDDETFGTIKMPVKKYTFKHLDARKIITERRNINSIKREG